MMKRFFQNKNIHIFLLVALISHPAFIHELMANYVICRGSNGHIGVERLNDCSDCNDIQYTELEKTTGTTLLDNQCCEDVALDNGCFEENQYPPKVRMLAANQLPKVEKNSFEPSVENFAYHNLFMNRSYNQSLEHYTTVSLLI